MLNPNQKRFIASLPIQAQRRLYWRIDDKMRSGGGCSFGIDRPTMRLVHPQLLEVMDYIFKANGRRSAGAYQL